MKSIFNGLLRILLFTGTFYSAMSLACDSVVDGCLGCSDEEIQACLNQLVIDICNEGGGVEACDRRRVFKDAERQVTLSTGRHYSRIRSMFRGAQKYQDPFYKH